jgi:hypothetical protein
LFIFYVEVQPNLSKVSASRRQKQINLFIFYIEAQPDLSKVSANEGRTAGAKIPEREG